MKDVKDDRSSTLDDQEDWSKRKKPHVEQDVQTSQVEETDTKQFCTTPGEVPDVEKDSGDYQDDQDDQTRKRNRYEEQKDGDYHEVETATRQHHETQWRFLMTG